VSRKRSVRTSLTESAVMSERFWQSGARSVRTVPVVCAPLICIPPECWSQWRVTTKNNMGTPVPWRRVTTRSFASPESHKIGGWKNKPLTTVGAMAPLFTVTHRHNKCRHLAWLCSPDSSNRGDSLVHLTPPGPPILTGICPPRGWQWTMLLLIAESTHRKRVFKNCWGDCVLLCSHRDHV
jgi:hypothetical protein